MCVLMYVLVVLSTVVSSQKLNSGNKVTVCQGGLSPYPWLHWIYFLFQLGVQFMPHDIDWKIDIIGSCEKRYCLWRHKWPGYCIPLWVRDDQLWKLQCNTFTLIRLLPILHLRSGKERYRDSQETVMVDQYSESLIITFPPSLPRSGFSTRVMTSIRFAGFKVDIWATTLGPSCDGLLCFGHL